MNLLRTIGTTVGWLSGSLAGITACFYAFGYVITLANLHLLGLDAFLFRYDPSFYLQRGGIFVLFVSGTIVVISLALLPLAAVFLLARSWFERRLQASKAGDKKAGFAAAVKRHWHLIRRLVLAALLVALVLLLVHNFKPLTQLVQVTDLLRQPAGAEREILALFAERARDALGGQFFKALYGLIGASLLLYLAWQLSSASRLRYLVIAPFVFVGLLYVVLVPVIYGTVKIRNEFSAISVAPVPGETPAAAQFYMLNKTGEAFLLWDAETQSVLWVPLSGLQTARIGPRRSIGEMKGTAAGRGD